MRLEIHTRTTSRRLVCRATLLLAALVLAACAATPLPRSSLEGTILNDLNYAPVRIVSVDGNLKFDGPASPINVAPGARWVVLEAASSRSARKTTQKSVVFKVEPCTRYVLGAVRHSTVETDWTLVVVNKDPVPGCNVADELRNAGLAATPASAVAN